MYWKKTIITFISLLSIALMYTGCNNDKEVKKEQNKNINIGTLAGKNEYEDEAVNWYAEKRLFLGDNVVVKIDGEYIKYIDPKVGDSVYACSRGNCNHNTKDCQAYFGKGCVYSCQDNNTLYVIQYNNEERTLVGYKCNTDGSGRTQIFEMESGEVSITDAFMANHQIYFNVKHRYVVDMDKNKYTDEEILYDSDREQNTIYGLDLESETIVKLIEFPTMSSSLVSRMFYAKGTLFVEHYYREKSLMTLADYVDEKLDSFQAIESAFLDKYDMNKYNEVLGFGCKQYVYNLKNGETKEVNEDFLQDAAINYANDEKIIFGGVVNKEAGLYEYDIKKDKVISVCNGAVQATAYIDNKLVCSIGNEKDEKYFVFDEDKQKLVEKRNLSEEICLGYIAEKSGYIFYENVNGDTLAISKKDFWNGKGNGVIIDKDTMEN